MKGMPEGTLLSKNQIVVPQEAREALGGKTRRQALGCGPREYGDLASAAEITGYGVARFVSPAVSGRLSEDGARQLGLTPLPDSVL